MKKFNPRPKYKDITYLRQYISLSGKILPRRITRLTSKAQRALKKAIKNGRIIGLLPFRRRRRDLEEEKKEEK